MPALDAYAQPLDAGQRVQQDVYQQGQDDLALKRKANDLALQEKQTQAAQLAMDTQTKSQMPIAGVDMLQWGDTPEYHGKAWHELPQEARDHFTQSYVPAVAANAPKLWNESVAGSTGKIPGVDNMEAAGATVDDAGHVTRHFKPTAPTGAAVELTPEERAIKESIVNYDMPLFGRGGMSQATREKISKAIASENGPDSAAPYNAQEYQSRQSARTLFKSGTAARNITSANTVIGHLDALNDAVDRLNNRSFTPWNKVANAAEGVMGDPAITKFNNIRDAAVTELAALFKGTGAAPTSEEINHWRANFDSSLSPQQLKENIKTAAVDLLGSRLSALQEMWDKGVKTNRDIPFLTPKSTAVLKKLGTDPAAIDPVAAPAATPTPTASKPQFVRQNGVTYSLQPDGSYK